MLYSQVGKNLLLADSLHPIAGPGWIAAHKALSQLRDHLSDRDAEDLIGGWLRDGRLEAFAERLLEKQKSFAVSLDLAPQALHSRLTPNVTILRDEQNVLIPPNFWASSANFESDARQWQWAAGVFTLTLPSEKPGLVIEREVRGPLFKTDDLQRLTPKFKSSTRDRQKDEHWAAFVAEVALAAWRREIDLGQNADDLFVDIEIRLRARFGRHSSIPSRTTSHSALRAALKLILEEGVGSERRDQSE